MAVQWGESCWNQVAVQRRLKSSFTQKAAFRVCLRGWANKAGPEGLPSVSNQRLLVGAGMSHDLHRESVKLHLKPYKLLLF